jgi:putative phosphoribosyl transferase
MIVGSEDRQVLALNISAMKAMKCNTSLSIVPGAGHLFEEEGTLDQALAAASDWYDKHLRALRPLFDDRRSAGRALASRMSQRALPNPVVYALPRGGVPVALEVAELLNAPLDLLLVRKIGVPWHPELAAGAVVDGEHPDIILNADIIRAAGLTDAEVTIRARAQLPEVERRRSLFMPGKRPVPARGKTAILVDDGIATGASMSAAIAAVGRRDPQRVIVAVPVMSRNSVLTLHGLVDKIVCLAAPDDFGGVGEFYGDFHQLSDEEGAALSRSFNALMISSRERMPAGLTKQTVAGMISGIERSDVSTVRISNPFSTAT